MKAKKKSRWKLTCQEVVKGHLQVQQRSRQKQQPQLVRRSTSQVCGWLYVGLTASRLLLELSSSLDTILWCLSVRCCSSMFWHDCLCLILQVIFVYFLISSVWLVLLKMFEALNGVKKYSLTFTRILFYMMCSCCYCAINYLANQMAQRNNEEHFSQVICRGFWGMPFLWYLFICGHSSNQILYDTIYLLTFLFRFLLSFVQCPLSDSTFWTLQLLLHLTFYIDCGYFKIVHLVLSFNLWTTNLLSIVVVRHLLWTY